MSAVPSSVRRQVIARDQGRCVVTGAYLVNPDTLLPYDLYSIHHRRPRGMGGSKDPATNAPENLLLVSGTGVTGAHGWIESNRRQAMAHGLLVSRFQDPQVVPVQHWLHGLAFLTPTGWDPIPRGLRGAAVVAERAAEVARAKGLDAADEGFLHISQLMRELTASWIGGGS